MKEVNENTEEFEDYGRKVIDEISGEGEKRERKKRNGCRMEERRRREGQLLDGLAR